MGVAAQRKPEMPGIARSVIGLHLAAQHRLHHLRLFSLVAHILEHAIEQRGGDDLAQRELAPEGGEIVTQSKQLLARRRFMHPVNHRRGLGLERLGRRDIGGDHEILDHAVRVEPFAHSDFRDLALLVEHHAAFGQFEFERVASVARLLQRPPAGP